MIADSQPMGTGPSAAVGGVAGLLRDTRIKLGRDIAVVATTLRIRQPYLQAIEEGRFEDLPGATYAVGFVRGYADYLGLDGNEIVRRFKQENSDLAGRNELVFPSVGSASSLPTAALLGLAAIGALLAYGVWYWLQERPEPLAETVPPLPERLAAMIHKPVGDAPDAATPLGPAPASLAASPSPVAITDAPPSAAEPPTVAETAAAAVAPPPEPARPGKGSKNRAPEPAHAGGGDNPTPAHAGGGDNPTPAHAGGGDNPTAALAGDAAAAAVTTSDAKPEPKPNWRPSKRVVLRADDSCWIKIRDASGQMVLSRLLHKGDVLSPPDRPGLEMTVGSAGALTVLVDGKVIPSLGSPGSVRHIALDPDKLDGGAPLTPPTTGSAPDQ